MLCYGKKGVSAPYAIKLLTQLELSKTLIERNKFVGKCVIKSKYAFIIFLSDSVAE